MSLLRSLVTERRSVMRHMPSMSGATTAAGVVVTPEKALQLSAVYACVTVIAENLGALPARIIRANGRRRLEVRDHRLAGLLTERPNDYMTAGEFWTQLTGWKLLRGNAYAVLAEISGAGVPGSLWPVPPTMIEPKRTKAGRVIYTGRLTDDWYVPGLGYQEEFELPARNVLHLRNFGLGLLGYSPISLARQGIAVTFAAEQYGAGLFARGAYPGGAIEVPEELSDEAFERLRESWKQAHASFVRSYEPAVLEGGAKWHSIGLPPEDAQFIETRKMGVQEIARLYGVPLHMIQEQDKSSSWGTGIEQMSIGFVVYTLLRHTTRTEHTVKASLAGFEPNEEFKFNLAGLLRGDTKSRYEGYAIARQWGWLSANDVLELEDRNPITGGDQYLVPLNMVPAGSVSPPVEGAAGRRELRQAPIRARHIEQHQRLIKGFFAEQDAALGERAGVDDPEWERRLRRLLVGAGFEAAADAAAVVAEQIGGEFDPEIMRGWLDANARHAARSINEQTAAALREALGADDPAAARAAVFGTGRAQILATTRVATCWNFGSHDAATHLGLGTKTWVVTSSKPRASHAALSGETVPLDEAFSNGGRWPGDPGLPVEEVAGCTCDLAFG